jgi:DNA-binding transcriptional LysR family regulator
MKQNFTVRQGALDGVEAFAPMVPGVFLYYPSRHQMMPKLRAFIDHVKGRSGATNNNNNNRRPRGMKMR